MQKKIESGISQDLKISLHGMDEKMTKMMLSYFKYTCKGLATIVADDNEAQVEIVDIDNHRFENILRQRLSQRSKKPIIALSLYEVSSKKVTFVKKPFNVSEMSAALKLVKKTLESNLISIQTKPIVSQKAVKKTNPNEFPLLSAIDLEEIKAFKAQFSQAEKTKNQEINRTNTVSNAQFYKKFVPEKIAVSNKYTKKIDKKNLIGKIAEKKINSNELPLLSAIDLEEIKAFKAQFSQTEKTENEEINRTNTVSNAQFDKKFVPEKIAVPNKGTKILDKKNSTHKIAVKESNPNELPLLSAIDLEEIKAFKAQFSQAGKIKKEEINRTNTVSNTQFDKKFVAERIGDFNKGQVFYGKSTKNIDKKNLRKTIRYTFQSISCKLKSHSFFGFKNNLLAVKILNISSNSALIQSKEPLKLKGKATIDIRFDLRNKFSVPIRIFRKNNNNTYGVIFLKRQHNLCDYLIDSGRPFEIDFLP